MAVNYGSANVLTTADPNVPVVYIPTSNVTASSSNGLHVQPVQIGYQAKPQNTRMEANGTVPSQTTVLMPEERLAENVKGGAMVLVLYTGGTIGMKVHNGVYTPEKNYLYQALSDLPMFHDKQASLTSGLSSSLQNPLILPLCKGKKRVVYCIYEYSPLLDSVNMTFQDYKRIANDIMENYNKFHGFVILHGTDTMSYTASALSFMLEYLGKPVVLTGAQIPLFETRSDGRNNFLSALIMAGNFNIPEVCVLFNDKLLRGNRSTKISAESFDAFDSPNCNYLAQLDSHIKVNYDEIYRPVWNNKRPFNAYLNMCQYVGVLRLFPSITNEIVRQFLQPPMQGVVIETYGAGNSPDTRPDLLSLFKHATEKGVIIVNISQCLEATTETNYASGKALEEAGVIYGGDMTPEAALMKLAYIIGKEHWTLDKKRKLMASNLRGEMTLMLSKENRLEMTLIEKMSDTLSLTSDKEKDLLRNTIFPPLMCSAARNNDPVAMEQLHRAGAKYTAGDYDQRTPLHVACSEGHVATVKFLLEHGADVHSRDRYGRSPLDDAVQCHQHAVVELLRQAGAHLVLPQRQIAMSMCNCVAGVDATTALKSWILAGANVNQADYDGRTALHVASACGKEDVVVYLLQHGASPNATDASKKTPKQEAKKYGHKNIVKILSNPKKMVGHT